MHRTVTSIGKQNRIALSYREKWIHDNVTLEAHLICGVLNQEWLNPIEICTRPT